MLFRDLIYLEEKLKLKYFNAVCSDTLYKVILKCFWVDGGQYTEN